MLLLYIMGLDKGLLRDLVGGLEGSGGKASKNVVGPQTLPFPLLCFPTMKQMASFSDCSHHDELCHTGLKPQDQLVNDWNLQNWAKRMLSSLQVDLSKVFNRNLTDTSDMQWEWRGKKQEWLPAGNFLMTHRLFSMMWSFKNVVGHVLQII